jgi:hypothetical protein
MHSALEPQPYNRMLHHQVLHHKMKDSFSSIYLTVLSVIQGVALADLASVVWSANKQFTFLQWLLVVSTFTMLIIIWDAYTQYSLLWVWVPNIWDAAIPFVIGSLELLLNHTIILSLSAWLFSLALLSGMAALANWHVRRQARKEVENTEMLTLLGGQTRWILFNFGSSFALLLLAIASRMGSLEVKEGIQGIRGFLAIALILLILGGLGFSEIMAIRSWNKVVTYARTGRMPPGR